MTQINPKKLAGIIGLSVIAILSIGLVSNTGSLFLADTVEPQPTPPPTPMELYGDKISNINDAKTISNLDWIKTPTVPPGFTHKEIRVDDEGQMVTVVYGNEQLDQIRDTFTENSVDGLVIVYSNNGGSKDWNSYVDSRIKQIPDKYSYQIIDGKKILLANAEPEYGKPAKAYLQNPPHSVTAISGTLSLDQLAKIVRSSFD